MKGLYFKGYHLILLILNCIMAYCLYAALFLCNTWKYRPIVLFVGIIIYLLLLLVTYDVTGHFSEKRLNHVTISMIIFMFVGLLCIGLRFKSARQADLFNLHYAAIDYLETGTLGNMDYYSVYPFQRNHTYILIGIYKLGSVLGIADYRTSGTIFGAIMIFLSGILMYAVACQLKGKRLGICALVFFMTNPIMYLYAGYYYNDLAAMPIFIGIIYLALLAEKCQKKKRRLVIFLLIGFFTHTGIQIRPVVGIASIAVILCVWFFWNIHWKERIQYTVSFGAGIIPSYIIWSILTKQMGGILDPNLEFPMTHCLMMGMNPAGRGRWSAEMWAYTASFPTYAEKIAGNLAQLSSDIRGMGVSGLCDLFLTKLRTIWSDGYTGISTNLGLVVRYGKLYEYTVGSKRFVTSYLTQIMRCSALVCVFPAFKFFKKCKSSMNMAIPILMFGYALFFLFWEVHERYLLMFLPMLFLIAAIGVGQLYQKILILCTSDKSINIRRIIWKTGCTMLIVTVLCALCYRSAMIGTPSDLYDVRLQQPTIQANMLLSKKTITQTFELDKEFNTISIKFMKDNAVPNGQQYRFILENDGNIICGQDFCSENVKNNANYTFSFDMVVPQTNVKYAIHLIAKENYEKSISVCHTNINGNGDYYDYGECIVDGKEIGDMTFGISKHVNSETFMKKSVFYIMVFGSLLLEILLFCYTGVIFKRGCLQKNDF